MSKIKPTFEEQLDQLEQIVKRLEQGDIPLEEALNQFQAGVKLSQKLQMTLTNAEKTLTHVVDDQGNEKNFEKENDDEEK